MRETVERSKHCRNDASEILEIGQLEDETSEMGWGMVKTRGHVTDGMPWKMTKTRAMTRPNLETIKNPPRAKRMKEIKKWKKKRRKVGKQPLEIFLVRVYKNKHIRNDNTILLETWQIRNKAFRC